jgi:hypothetical protein
MLPPKYSFVRDFMFPHSGRVPEIMFEPRYNSDRRVILPQSGSCPLIFWLLNRLHPLVRYFQWILHKHSHLYQLTTVYPLRECSIKLVAAFQRSEFGFRFAFVLSTRTHRYERLGEPFHSGRVPVILFPPKYLSLVSQSVQRREATNTLIRVLMFGHSGSVPSIILLLNDLIDMSKSVSYSLKENLQDSQRSKIGPLWNRSSELITIQRPAIISNPKG